MANLTAARQSQFVMEAEFVFSIGATTGDTMTNTSGAADNFHGVASHIFDVINLPPNAIVVGGEVVTETAVTGSTAYNITVGDSGVANRYLGTTDRTAAGRTALVPTGFVSDGENLRLTVTPTVAASTAGKISVKVMYIQRGRANENVTS